MSLFASLSSHVVSLLEKELLNNESVVGHLVVQEMELLIKKLEHILETRRMSQDEQK